MCTLPAMRPAVRTARRLRRTMSLPEVMLWQHLRRRPGGLYIRRQHPLDCHVLDFWCAPARLAVEIDGHAHHTADRPERDRQRDLLLAAQGIVTLRIPAAAVLRDPVEVAESIVAACQARVRERASDGSDAAGGGREG